MHGAHDHATKDTAPPDFRQRTATAPDDGFAAVLPLGGSERQGGAGDRGKHWDWLRDSQGVGWHGRAHSDRLPQRAESARGDRIIGASLNLHARHMPVMDCASLHDDASAVMLPSCLAGSLKAEGGGLSTTVRTEPPY